MSEEFAGNIVYATMNMATLSSIGILSKQLRLPPPKFPYHCTILNTMKCLQQNNTTTVYDTPIVVRGEDCILISTFKNLGWYVTIEFECPDLWIRRMLLCHNNKLAMVNSKLHVTLALAASHKRTEFKCSGLPFNWCSIKNTVMRSFLNKFYSIEIRLKALSLYIYFLYINSMG